MKADALESNVNSRNMDRSPYRNMSEKCLYCAYRNRPSSTGITCSSCSGMYQSKNGNGK